MPSMHMMLDLSTEEENRILRVQYREPIQQSEDTWYIKPVPGGMSSGRGALHVWIPGKYKNKDVLMYAETSVQSWMQATAVIRAKFEAEIDDPGWAVLPQNVKDLLIPRYMETLRRVMPGVNDDQAREISEMFLDALAAGSPEDLHGG